MNVTCKNTHFECPYIRTHTKEKPSKIPNAILPFSTEWPCILIRCCKLLVHRFQLEYAQNLPQLLYLQGTITEPLHFRLAQGYALMVQCSLQLILMSIFNHLKFLTFSLPFFTEWPCILSTLEPTSLDETIDALQNGLVYTFSVFCIKLCTIVFYHYVLHCGLSYTG